MMCMYSIHIIYIYIIVYHIYWVVVSENVCFR